jgi:predicted RNase H-like nuclease (RuvC/YqgF family)
MQLHRTDNLRIMQENVALIKEINELRREIKMLKAAAQRFSTSSNSNALSKDLETQRNLVSDLQLQVHPPPTLSSTTL